MSIPSPKDNSELARLYAVIGEKSHTLSAAEAAHIHAKQEWERARDAYDALQKSLSETQK